MRTVLLDTVGLIALWERQDQWHNDAAQAMRMLSADNATMFTTSLILHECGNAAARKPYRGDVEQLRAELVANGRLIVPTAGDEENGWLAYRNEGAGSAGIVDCISFAVMHRLNIAEAFTNDRHFRAAGFRTLF